MKRRITDIQAHQQRNSRCLIYLDEEPFQEVDKGLVTKFGLRVGLEIEEEALQALIRQDEIPRAKRYAFDLLVRRAYSRADMEQKLLKKGFSKDSVEETLQTLQRLGYVKDIAYAEDWVAHRSRNKPRGKRLLRHELSKKGIDKTTVDRVLEDIDEEQEFQLAMRAAKKQALRYQRLSPEVSSRRLYGFLQRRGFESNVCRRVIEAVLSSHPSRSRYSRGESKHVDRQ